LGALGAAGVVASMFLPWRTGSVHPTDIPVAYLWDRSAGHDPSLLTFLIPLAVVIVIGTLLPRASGARVLGGLGTLIVVGVFAYQLDRTVNASGGNLGDVIDTGFYFAAIGGLLAFLSGFFPSGWSRRRTVDREPAANREAPAEREVPSGHERDVPQEMADERYPDTRNETRV
jgi:hypothetical protein